MFRRFRLIALALPVLAGCYDQRDARSARPLEQQRVVHPVRGDRHQHLRRLPVGRHQRQHPAALVPGAGGAAGGRQLLPAEPEHAGLPRAVHEQRDPGAGRRRHRHRVRTARRRRSRTTSATSRCRASPTPDLFTNVGIADQHLRAAADLLPRRPDAVERGEGGAAHAAQHRDRLVRRDRRRVVRFPTRATPIRSRPIGGVRGRTTPGSPTAWRRLDTKVVAFTIPDVTQIPYTSRGSTYWCLKTGACAASRRRVPANFHVSTTTARPNAAIPGSKGDSVLVPWTIGVAGLLRASSPPFTPFTLDCSNTLQVVTPDGVRVRAEHDRPDEPAHPRRRQPRAAGRWWRRGPIFAQLQVQDGGIPAFPEPRRRADRRLDQFRQLVLARRVPPELGNPPGGRRLDDRGGEPDLRRPRSRAVP